MGDVPVLKPREAERPGGTHMGSVVLELQKEALDRDTAVSDLLRKAMVLARKLKIREFEAGIATSLVVTPATRTTSRRLAGHVKVFNRVRLELSARAL
jgi:hypothetical protein